MKHILFVCILLVSMQIYPGNADSFDTPRLAIVISEASYAQRWGVTQMSAHGWAGVANLSGIPYDCLFIHDVAQSSDLSKYDLLIFAQCAYVDEKYYKGLLSALQDYLTKSGNLIIDGPLATSDKDARDLKHKDLDDLLGLQYDGFRGDMNFRIKVTGNLHYITKPFESGQFITQHLVNGLNVITFRQHADILLQSSDENENYPFLSCFESERNRLVLISDFSTWSGAASFFRNVSPQVFYANQLFNVLMRTVHWAIYGDIATPFPVPQVSNANLTAIVRLDADASQNLDAQIKTINYLTDIANESGVVPVYAWVSSSATKAGWQDLAPLGKKLEDVGGEIGTHSNFHHIDQKMNEKRWQEELDGSIKEIEFNMNDYGYPIGKVEWFINPGNTIRMKDYDQVAKRFSFYMTHGFEQDMPIGWGNLTWFTGDNKNLVVLENTPSPDYQWFYDPTWSYTTAQITAYEEAIFDHLFDNIGRGVIFDEMWHDYSITSQKYSPKDRIINESNIAMYDAIKTKFATHRIYCPTPEDLGHKVRAMAQWDYSWKSSNDRIETTLNLSNVRSDTIHHFTGGMGIRIENSDCVIQTVVINGDDYPGFTDNLVILPNLRKGENKIVVALGTHSPETPRLTYVSKLMPALKKSGNRLEMDVRTKSKARFSFAVKSPFVLLNSDWQEWNRDAPGVLNGFVTSDSKVILQSLENDFFITNTNVRITNYEESANAITLFLDKHEKKETPVIRFCSASTPGKVSLDGKVLTVRTISNMYEVELPSFTQTAKLDIRFNL